MKFLDKHMDTVVNIFISSVLIAVNCMCLVSVIKSFETVKLNIFVEVIIAVVNILFVLDGIECMNIMSAGRFNMFTSNIITKTAVVGIMYTIYDFKTTGKANIVNISCIVTSSLIVGIVLIVKMSEIIDAFKEESEAQKRC